MQERSFTTAGVTQRVHYRVGAGGVIDLELDGTAHRAEVQGWDAGGITLVIDGIRRTSHVITHGDVHYVSSSLGTSELRAVPRFPEPERATVQGGCRAPMPGRILAVHVGAAQTVQKGETLAILEAMKMEHAVVAPQDGVVREVFVQVGQQVEAGDVLVALDETKGANRGPLDSV
jgi:propionyl-CoA carboxylase alpha chain